MSAADSTETPRPGPLAEAAARGELPDWSAAGPERRAHMARVAELMGRWADALGLPPGERTEWVAAGWLHDALREGEPDRLREMVPLEQKELHPLLLHGPAAAERLRGQVSDSLLNAARYHTIGHPCLDRLGRALYLADFLEPGRDFEEEWRASLAARMPQEMDEVLREVVAARIEHLIEIRKPIRPETAAFWSSLVGGQ